MALLPVPHSSFQSRSVSIATRDFLRILPRSSQLRGSPIPFAIKFWKEKCSTVPTDVYPTVVYPAVDLEDHVHSLG